jgi:hypothetical protein
VKVRVDFGTVANYVERALVLDDDGTLLVRIPLENEVEPGGSVVVNLPGVGFPRSWGWVENKP